MPEQTIPEPLLVEGQSSGVAVQRRPMARGDGLAADSAAALLATPPPPVDEAAAEAALRDHYGLDGRAQPLAAERDRNFMVALADGTRRVFKVYHEAEDAETRAFQTGVFLHMERAGVACAVPRLIRTRDGTADCGVEAAGRGYRAILISVVPGAPGDLGGAGPALRSDLGRAAAAIGLALAGYDHPAARRVLLWDLMQLGRLAWLVDGVADAARRRWLAGTLARFDTEVRPRALDLPAQVIHNDMNGSNVFVAGEAVSGVIDFGDMVRAPRVNEIAVAANYVLAATLDPVDAIGDVLEGYETVRRLEEAEVGLLHDLVLARLATRLLVYLWRTELFPENRDYTLRHAETGWRLADVFAAMAPGAGRDAIIERWASRRGSP